MKKITMIGQFPPPIHGLSKALNAFAESVRVNSLYEVRKINLTHKKELFSIFKRVIQTKNQIGYLTISHSILGNLRDLLIVKILNDNSNHVILHYHGGHYKELFKNMNFIQKYLNRKIFGKVNKIIVLGNSHKNLFEDVVSSDKIYVCENFVEDASFLTDTEYKNSKQDSRNNKIVLLYLSNLIKTKGYEDVLKAFKILATEYPNEYELHIAGAHYEIDSQMKINKALNDSVLENSIFYHGIVDGGVKKDLLYRSDVFLLPTYYPYEGQPISVIEAMASGMVCVTTELGGIKDVLHQDNSFYVNAKAPVEIAEMIRSLNFETIHKVGDLNRNKAKNQFSEKDYIQRLINILEHNEEEMRNSDAT